MNEWLKKRAGQWQRKELSRCYVAVQRGQTDVCAYYAISSHHVSCATLATDQAKGLPRIDVPVVLLGRLAVDAQSKGYGLGQLLLLDALRRSEYVAQEIGLRAVEVDAIDDAAREFYLKYGFTSLADDRNHLYLPMHVIRKLGLPSIGESH